SNSSSSLTSASAVRTSAAPTLDTACSVLPPPNTTATPGFSRVSPPQTLTGGSRLRCVQGLADVGQEVGGVLDPAREAHQSLGGVVAPLRAPVGGAVQAAEGGGREDQLRGAQEAAAGGLLRQGGRP